MVRQGTGKSHQTKEGTEMKIAKFYKANKAAARYHNTEPSLTDQSQANDTDVNVIVKKFAITGQAPGGRTPNYGDFTQLPKDLRELLAMNKSVKGYRDTLPEQLRDLEIEELLALSEQDITKILTPKEEPKKEAEQK